MQNLAKEPKQSPVVILQQAIFYNQFILCLWLRIIWTYNVNHFTNKSINSLNTGSMNL